jgi:hypothetical protein
MLFASVLARAQHPRTRHCRADRAGYALAGRATVDHANERAYEASRYVDAVPESDTPELSSSVVLLRGWTSA